MSAAERVEGPTTPRFTVLMAAHNAAGTIGEAVRSVLAQTYTSWAMVVVDDGSTDDTAEVARNAAAGDSRITVLSQANQGVGAARNRAAAGATSEFLAILDSDDWYSPEFFERQSRFIDAHPGFDIYSCNGTYVFPGGRRLVIWRGSQYRRVRSDTLLGTLERNRIFIQAIVRRETFERAGGFGAVRIAEDVDLWVRMFALGGKHIYNPARIGYYRVSSQSLATARDKMERARLDIIERLIASSSGPDAESLAAIRDRQEARLEVALLDHRIVEGDTRDARRIFFRNAYALPTVARRILGRMTMLLSPVLYGRVFLGRTQSRAARKRVETGGSG